MTEDSVQRPVFAQQHTVDPEDPAATEIRDGSIDFGPETAGLRTSDVTGQSSSESQTHTQSKGGFMGALSFRRREEDRKGTWGTTGYNASDDQAHRNVTYRTPSFLKQTLIVFMVQMKLFSKLKWTYLSLFLALLIPIITLTMSDTLDMMMAGFGFMSNYSNTYIAGLLAFLPLFLGLITSVMCGTQLPSEFKERTAYMNVSLPMSRISFYLGKYLAGFTMCLGVFMFAYGMAVATSMFKYDSIFTDLLTESIVLTIVAVFAYSATAFCLGSFMRRGSSMVPFMLMTIVLPTVFFLVFLYYYSNGTDLSWLLLLPCFLGEAALGLLGAQMSGSVGIMAIGYLDLTEVWTMAGIGLVWGLVFILLGMFKIMRREM